MGASKKLIRYNFREAVFNRDGWKCKFCDITYNLDAHHIININLMPNGGYVKENGISLCEKHHKIAEESLEPYVQPEELFKLINSSYSQAYSKSLKL